MLEALLAMSSRMTDWFYGPREMSDDDGACQACDHPFGESSHICFGGVTRVAA